MASATQTSPHECRSGLLGKIRACGEPCQSRATARRREDLSVRQFPPAGRMDSVRQTHIARTDLCAGRDTRRSVTGDNCFHRTRTAESGRPRSPTRSAPSNPSLLPKPTHLERESQSWPVVEYVPNSLVRINDDKAATEGTIHLHRKRITADSAAARGCGRKGGVLGLIRVHLRNV